VVTITFCWPESAIVTPSTPSPLDVTWPEIRYFAEQMLLAIGTLMVLEVAVPPPLRWTIT
jgi:hypothetical protein